MLPSCYFEKQTIDVWQQLLVGGQEDLKSSDSIKIIKIENPHLLFANLTFMVDRQVVMAFSWARVLCHLAVEEARFRTRIILGVVLVRSLALCLMRAGMAPE